MSRKGVVSPPEDFPKSSRLLKKRDFRFDEHRRFQSRYFTFVYTQIGRGRLGISISKKVLKKAISRNRVRRLIREVFRRRGTDFQGIDVHLVGRSALSDRWDQLVRADIDSEFERFSDELRRKGPR